MASETSGSGDKIWLPILLTFLALSILVAVYASIMWWRQYQARLQRKKSAGLPIRSNNHLSQSNVAGVVNHIQVASTLHRSESAASSTYNPYGSRLQRGDLSTVTSVGSPTASRASSISRAHGGSAFKDMPPLPTNYALSQSPVASAPVKNGFSDDSNYELNKSTDLLNGAAHNNKSPVSDSIRNSLSNILEMNDSVPELKASKKKDHPQSSKHKKAITLNIKPKVQQDTIQEISLTDGYSFTKSSIGGVGSFPLSVPGFLKMEYARDYAEVANAQISSNSFADISPGMLIDPACVERNEKISECVVKRFKELSINEEDQEEEEAAFFYEVAILAAVRGFPNVARLIGYSDAPRVIVMKKYNLTLSRLLFAGASSGSKSSISHSSLNNLAANSFPTVSSLNNNNSNNSKTFRSSSSINLNPGTILFSMIASRKSGSSGNIQIAQPSGINNQSNDVWMTPSIAWKIAFDIGNGMRALHKHQVLHRNLTTSSILVQVNTDSSFYCVISDFGSSKVLGSEVKGLKRPNTSIVSYPYASPERLADDSCKSVDKSIDVYAYSMILYEIITQRQAWDSQPSSYIEARVKAGERPAIPADILEGYAKSRESILLDIMLQSWSQEPQDRPSFIQIMERFEDASSTFVNTLQ